MHNYLLRVAFAGLACLLLCSTGWAQDQNLPSDYEARSIVLTYLDALSQGDVFTIKQLLGGDFLEQRRNSLDNPSYANLLSKRYSLATSSIVGTQQINQHHLAVDALIELSPDEALQCRFIVAVDENEQLKIVEETHYDN